MTVTGPAYCRHPPLMATFIPDSTGIISRIYTSRSFYFICILINISFVIHCLSGVTCGQQASPSWRLGFHGTWIQSRALFTSGWETQAPAAEGVQSAFQPLKSNYHNTYKSKIITKDGKLEIADELADVPVSTKATHRTVYGDGVNLMVGCTVRTQPVTYPYP